MQTTDIASYVPQQAIPRYRTVTPKRPEELPSPSKIATYVNIGGTKTMPNHSLTTKLMKNSVNITPVVTPGGAGNFLNQRPQGNANNPAIRVRAAGGETKHSHPSMPPMPASMPMARWAKVPSTRVTTVNKVTLPARPNVIDLTDEDLEKERNAAAAINRALAAKNLT